MNIAWKFLSFVQDSFTRTVTWHVIIDCEKLVHLSVIDCLLVGSWRTWRRVLTCQYPAMSRQALQRMSKTTMWWWSLDCLSSSSLNTVRTVWYNSWWGRSKTPCSAIYESRMIWYLDHILGFLNAENLMHKASLATILLWFGKASAQPFFSKAQSRTAERRSSIGADCHWLAAIPISGSRNCWVM